MTHGGTVSAAQRERLAARLNLEVPPPPPEASRLLVEAAAKRVQELQQRVAVLEAENAELRKAIGLVEEAESQEAEKEADTVPYSDTVIE